MANYDKYGRTVSTDPGSASAFPDGISSSSASGGPYVPQKWVFNLVAGSAGADDVTLVSSMPSKCYILKVDVMPTATVSMGTVTIRTASGGGGTALSSAVACAAAGTLGSSTGVAGNGATVAAGTALYARRSDGTVAGIVEITWVPTV